MLETMHSADTLCNLCDTRNLLYRTLQSPLPRSVCCAAVIEMHMRSLDFKNQLHEKAVSDDGSTYHRPGCMPGTFLPV